MYDPERGYPRVVPYLLYADPNAAVAWLSDVLGLREVIRFAMPDGKWATLSSSAGAPSWPSG